jgi:hypothetical protein
MLPQNHTLSSVKFSVRPGQAVIVTPALQLLKDLYVGIRELVYLCIHCNPETLRSHAVFGPHISKSPMEMNHSLVTSLQMFITHDEENQGRLGIPEKNGGALQRVPFQS